MNIVVITNHELQTLNMNCLGPDFWVVNYIRGRLKNAGFDLQQPLTATHDAYGNITYEQTKKDNKDESNP